MKIMFPSIKYKAVINAITLTVPSEIKGEKIGFLSYFSNNLKILPSLIFSTPMSLIYGSKLEDKL